MNPSPRAALAGLLVVAAGLPGQQQGAEPPHVMALEPTHLSTGVAAKTNRLVIRFDQDMDRTVHALCGGGASFPRVVRTHWPDARTFAVDVELQPDRVYAMDLACPGSAGFRAATGAVLAPQPWRIATAGEPLADGVAAAAATRLFAALRDHYSYRDRIGVDWNELEQRHAEALRTAVDGPALALLITDLLVTAQDPHITVRWQDGMLPTWRPRTVANFDQRGLQRLLPRLDRVGRAAFAARTDDGIGYLLVPSFAREQRDEFERILQTLRGLLDCKALVLDVRTNSGGDEMLARRLAAFFVRDEVVYARHRTRDPRAEGGFSPVEERTLRANTAPDVFDRPVAVLMGPLNMSSTEAFLLMMKQAPQAVLVGADSFGSSGNPQPHTLLPGLVVQLPSWQALRPDGTLLEGEGVAPHLHVDTRPDQLVDDDPVLAAALARLRGKR